MAQPPVSLSDQIYPMREMMTRAGLSLTGSMWMTFQALPVSFKIKAKILAKIYKSCLI